MSELLVTERVFLNRSLYQEAERLYSLRNNLPAVQAATSAVSAKCQNIKSDVSGGDSVKVGDLVNRLKTVEEENKHLRSVIEQLENRLKKLEVGGGNQSSAVSKPAAAPAPAPAKPAADDDDFDLFDDDDEDSDEKKRLTEERLKAYNDKKSKKPALVAKSSVLLDVKVWDDETDMKALEESVRSIQMDGLVWGSSKLVPVAFGVKKLQIQCVIEDDKVSTEALEEQICAFEDFVQSVDIASFNKI